MCLSKSDERVTEKEAGLKVKLFCEAGDVWRSYTTQKVSGAAARLQGTAPMDGQAQEEIPGKSRPRYQLTL